MARRIGRLAVPLLVLPIGMHHLRFIDSPTFFVAMILAGAVAALAVFVALIALIRLWYSGDRGWRRALSGLFLGALCLAPFGWYGALAWRYPVVTDIATADRGELPLVLDNATVRMPPPFLISAVDQARVFPNATTRTYPLSANQVFVLVASQVEGEGWDVRLKREPGPNGEAGRINARIVTLLGWQEEVVIRVLQVGGASAVDMRSVSLNAPHDFGSNGTRIARFMVALDNDVTSLLRDNPDANQPVVEEDEEPAPVVEQGES